MRFELRSAKNGCILKAWHTAEGSDQREELVCQESYAEDDEVERFADFLRIIADNYGPSTSRYSAKRIYITVGPGDKHS